MGVSIFSPAKINLFLAVTGRRADGYHDLVSLVARLDFGDQLVAEVRGPSFAKASAGSQFTLECDHPAVPLDDSNLILKAAQAFAAATGWDQGVNFKLTKRIPLGAGLGGGSSNAVAALRALNSLSGGLLAEVRLAEVAATLGSDCALFLPNAPVVMRGRGERVEALPKTTAQRLRGRRVLLFKPGFAISTAWAYGRMAAEASSFAKASAVAEAMADKPEDRTAVYLPVAQAEEKLAAWRRSRAPAEELLFNNMEGVVFGKFMALPVLVEKLRAEFGLATRMSGSGSTCFALLRDDFVTAPLTAYIRQCWGPTAWVQEARMA